MDLMPYIIRAVDHGIGLEPMFASNLPSMVILPSMLTTMAISLNSQHNQGCNGSYH